MSWHETPCLNLTSKETKTATGPFTRQVRRLKKMEKVEKAIILIKKINNSARAIHFFCIFIPNFTFYATRAGYVLCQNSSRAKSNKHRRAVDKTNIKSKPTGAHQF